MIHLKVWVARSTINTMHPCINRRTTRTPDLRISLVQIEADIAQGNCSLMTLTGMIKIRTPSISPTLSGVAAVVVDPLIVVPGEVVMTA